jgi:hypothetical protein
MAKPFYIQDGVVSNTQKRGASSYTQLFDVRKWTTDLLVDYGILTADPCCSGATTGISGNISNARYSVFTGIEASGTTAADATVLEYGVNVVEIADLSNTGVKLPQPVTGKSVRIINMTTVAIYVYPSNVGGKINNLPVDTPLAIPADGTAYEFICTENPLPGNWNSINPPGTSSIVFTIGINHTQGVADWISTTGNGTAVNGSSVYTTMGVGSAFTLNPSSASWFSLPQPAKSTYLKVYSNVITSDLGPNYNDGILVKRNAFFVQSNAPAPGYTGVNTWGDEILFLQDISFSPYITAVTGGPTPTSSPAAGIGDDTTLYSEQPAIVFDQMGILNLPNIVSNVFCNYSIYIPASAATKNYLFYIVQEYV